MNWQIGNVWSCPIARCDGLRWGAMVCGEFRWFADSCDTRILRRNVYYLLMSRLGGDLGPIRSEFAFDPTRQMQNGPKTDPKWTQNASKSHTNRHDHKRNLLFDPTWHSPAFYKTIEICEGNECLLKRTFVYPEWLHSDCKVMPNWTRVTLISQKCSQSDFKVIPKWPQSAPKWLQHNAKVTSK